MATGPTLRPARYTRGDSDGHVLADQVHLLYSNANVGVGVTLVGTAVVAALEWRMVSHAMLLAWSLYMVSVAAYRFALWRAYRRTPPAHADAARWNTRFAVGAGLAGCGWGAAGVLLYPQASLTGQVFLVFIVGGMMLGASSILAPRPEAFLPFLIPAGLGPSARLLLNGGDVHVGMGIMALVFTVATILITRRIHQAITSSLKLQFQNQDLVEDLRAAKDRADRLNEQLEARVRERTAELQRSTEQLRAEIAQREQMEEELLRARKLESLGVFAGGIAHDFNNFLTIVQGNVEMARIKLDAGEPVGDILQQTASACRRAASLSSQLLTFAQGGAPVRRLVSMAALVADAVHLARAGASIEIKAHIAEDLWSAEVDPGQVGQVLHNILLNARQAMPDGGTIEVHAENVTSSSGPCVRISIRDHGSGIPPDVLPRIFDPYFTTRPGGSGLGLATAYAIVNRHHGSLSVESQPGRGSVFTIDLPASMEPAPPQSATAPRVQTGTERLLVMDDEESLRRLLESVLTRLGYEVQTARDGAEAIALYERAKASGRGFDAVLLDVTVSGGMGGVEAAARLKQLDPAARLIVSSGYSDAPVMADFRRYGFDDVIPKPWAVADISAVFRRVFARPAGQS